MAVDTGSGLVQWVLDGTLVESKVIGEMINSTNVPTDLTGRLVFGAVEYAAGSWMMISNKVANVNVFSSALNVEEMQKRTQGGECAGEGDYLSWEDTQWSLHGKAAIEIVESAELCNEKPLVDLYTTPLAGARMESCMQFCENVASRVPSVTTLAQWSALRNFLSRAYDEKALYTLDLQNDPRGYDAVSDHLESLSASVLKILTLCMIKKMCFQKYPEKAKIQSFPMMYIFGGQKSGSSGGGRHPQF